MAMAPRKPNHTNRGDSQPSIPPQPTPQHPTRVQHSQDQVDSRPNPHQPPFPLLGHTLPPTLPLSNAQHPQGQTDPFVINTSQPNPGPVEKNPPEPPPPSPSPAIQKREDPILPPSIDDYVSPSSDFFAGHRNANPQRKQGIARYLEDWDDLWKRLADSNGGNGGGGKEEG